MKFINIVPIYRAKKTCPKTRQAYLLIAYKRPKLVCSSWCSFWYTNFLFYESTAETTSTYIESHCSSTKFCFNFEQVRAPCAFCVVVSLTYFTSVQRSFSANITSSRHIFTFLINIQREFLNNI